MNKQELIKELTAQIDLATTAWRCNKTGQIERENFWIHYRGGLVHAMSLAEKLSPWTPVDRDNLPEGEVIGICLDKSSVDYKRAIYGRVFIHNDKAWIELAPFLLHITHYQEIPEL